MDIVNVLDKGYVRVINVMGSDIDVANAARVSYDKSSSLDENGNILSRDKGLIDFLWKEEHTSPFRHCVLSFEIYAPLFVARQHWKYAVSSTFVDDQNGWNESSRRYITEDPKFYIPGVNAWRSAPENMKQGSGDIVEPYTGAKFMKALEDYCKLGESAYEEALRDGICPEQARLFLPAYGMYVRYRWTTSLHGIMHFLSQRLAHDTQLEMQRYAQALQKLSEKHFPYSLSLI